MGQTIKEFTGTCALAVLLAGLLGVAYGFYDLILVLLYQPQGMEDAYFLTAYLLLGIAAVSLVWAGVFCGLAVVSTALAWHRHWLYSLCIGLGLFMAYARFNGMGIQELVLPLFSFSMGNVYRGVLLILIISALSLGVWALHLFLDFKPRTQQILTRLTSAIPWLLGMGCYGLWFYRVQESISLNQFIAILVTTPLVALTVCTFRDTFWALVTNSALTILVLLSVLYLIISTHPAETNEVISPSSPKGPRHVLLVVSDTLRRDALSCYNSQAKPTPHIDALAKDGIRFEHAYAPSFWTTPSMVSIMTGLTPVEHGVMDKGPLSQDVETLAEAMQARGYTTGAIGFNPMLRPEMAGLEQGFDKISWQPNNDKRKSYLGSRLIARLFPDHWPYTTDTTGLTKAAMQWYDAYGEQATFLWLHYFDPHDDYEPPAEYMPESTAPEGVPAHHFRGAMPGVRTGHRAKDSASRDWYHQLYLGEVQYVDAEFGRLVEHLKKLKLYDDMQIVFVSDHGEEFWEHGGFGHGHSLYGECINVPLIIKQPGNSRSRTVSNAVSTVDLMPTLLMEKERVLFSANRKNTPLFSSGTLYFEPQDSVILGDWKLIRWHTSGRAALYNLNEDPEEQHNRIDDKPELVKQLRTLLDGYEAKKTGQSSTQSTTLDTTTREQLQSLGYIE